MQHIAIVQQQSPFNCSAGREALDLTLALAAVEHQLSLIFSGDAIYQLLPVNLNVNFGLKRYQQGFKLFGLYDIERLYVCSQSMQQRQINVEDLSLTVQLLDPLQLQQLLAKQQQIVCI
jgi:tRNA 2-thiouridine synthesizing protein C